MKKITESNSIINFCNNANSINKVQSNFHNLNILSFIGKVSYADTHDINSYYIELNNRKVYQCSTMTQTNHDVSNKLKINSCYTSGLINLNVGDKIQIKDHGYHRNVTLEPSKSFFGLVKINIHPIEHFNKEAESIEIWEWKYINFNTTKLNSLYFNVKTGGSSCCFT